MTYTLNRCICFMGLLMIFKILLRHPKRQHFEPISAFWAICYMEKTCISNMKKAPHSKQNCGNATQIHQVCSWIAKEKNLTSCSSVKSVIQPAQVKRGSFFNAGSKCFPQAALVRTDKYCHMPSCPAIKRWQCNTGFCTVTTRKTQKCGQ